MTTAWAIATIVSLTITGLLGYVAALPKPATEMSEDERAKILAFWLTWETIAIACVVHACVDGVTR